MQLAVSGTEFLLFEKQWIIKKGKGVKDIKIELRTGQLQVQT